MCAQANPQGALHIHQSLHQLRGHQLGEDCQVDFTHMPTHKKLCCLLTLVDTFTGWIETFPASREMADAVTQVLLDHIIPHFGILRTIQKDNGLAFTSRVGSCLSEGTQHLLKIPHPLPSTILRKGGENQWTHQTTANQTLH